MTTRSRRTLLTSTAAVSATTALGVHLATAQSTPSASPVGDTWTFTDDRGRTVTLPSTPTRIFADSGAGLALWDLGIKPVGLAGYAGIFAIPDELADVPFLDLEAGLDIEAVAALHPDLIVSQSWDTVTNNDFGGVDENELPGLLQIAPTIGIRALELSLVDQIDRFEELAGLLGADLDAPNVVAAREAFTQAAEAVRSAAAEKPGLTAVAISPDPDLAYIGNPAVTSDLMFFRELGVNLLDVIGTADEVSGMFGEVSWEQINRYNADLVLSDDRIMSMPTDELLAIPTFALLPAAQAGQIGAWTVEYVSSYQGVTPILEALAATITAAKIVTQ